MGRRFTRSRDDDYVGLNTRHLPLPSGGPAVAVVGSHRVSNSESTLLATHDATKFAAWLAARLAPGSQQGGNHARQHPKQQGWQQRVNGRLASGEAFRRMSCRMFRVHRVAVSRDFARPAARFERAAETVRLHGVTRALTNFTFCRFHAFVLSGRGWTIPAA